ncbi:MAG: hypothetical protein IJO48_05825 [Clostridia bacterium]|nr:hypothetical protein [Clostridia bacterium]
MMKWIWGSMLLLSMSFAIFAGNPDSILDSMLEGAGEAVTLSISLCGAYMLWMGIMNIAKDAGLIESLSRLMQRPLQKLFPSSKKAIAPITLNLAANFFGMGSAATPFGLMAMKELKKEGNTTNTASDDMCMFLSLNSSAIELLPTSVIAMRAAAGSQNVYSVVVPTFIASVFAFASAIIACRIFARIGKKIKR